MIIVPQQVTAAGNRTRLTDFFGQFVIYIRQQVFPVLLPFFVSGLNMHKERLQRWQALVGQVSNDYRRLSKAEKDWIATRLVQLERLQEELNRLFERGGGLQTCAKCQGDCCAKGHNHMTLANLLGFLWHDELPPEPDFTSTCPFLAGPGCLLPVARRPYNCISFVCDIIESSLTFAEVEEFYQLEQQLRSIYQQFAGRYAGGGLTGLLLQAERLAGRSFLELKAAAEVVPASR